MEYHFEITNSIRKLRFFNGEMTQQQLAEKAGVSRQTVIAVEGGKYTPSLELAFRIAYAFGVPLDQVFECHVTGKESKGGKKK